jgi:hypothetical protein
LVENAQNKTFGVTIARFGKAGLVTPELQRRLDQLLGERNWLVHNSRASSRNAVHHDAALMKLLARLDQIAEESLGLLKEISGLTDHFVKKHGVTEEQIREGAKHLLDGREVKTGNTIINGINDGGWIVGQYDTFEPRPDGRNTQHGFLWKPDSTGTYVPSKHVPIDIVGAKDTAVNGIANNGTFVGYYIDGLNNTGRHAFVGQLAL